MKYLIVLLTLLNICILYGVSTYTKPTAITLDELPDYEGKQVIVTGKITNFYTTSYGSQLINIISPEPNNTAKATLFLEEVANVSYGDIIQAMGTVQHYKNTWELIVDSPSRVRCIQPWNDTTVPLHVLAVSPERYVGMNLHITGYVERIYDSFCYITNKDQIYTLTIVFDDAFLPKIFPGDAITVGGRFEFNEHTLRYQLVISEKEHFLQRCEAPS